MVYVTAHNEVADVHNWATCPSTARHPYLVHQHRHTFVIETRFRVTDDDRQIEIFEAEDRVRDCILGLYTTLPNGLVDFGASSCEMIARKVCNVVGADFCEVREDGRGGASYART